jgi:hypothetical protein
MDLALSILATACPSCQTGQDARALVIGNAFVPHLLGGLVPFVLVLLIVALVVRGIDRSRW